MRFRTAAVAALAIAAAHAASAEEITLMFTTTGPQMQAPTPQVSTPWAEHVSEVGKGVVKIEMNYGPSVASPANFYPRLQNDVVQIAWGLQGSVGGVFPLSDVARVPYLVEKAEQGSVAFWRLYRSGLLDSDYKDTHPLALAMFPQGVLHLSKPPKSVDDLAGLKLVANSKMTADIITRMGATPITILIQETYQALQRHTVDGTVTGYPAVMPFKFYEVTTYHFDAMLGGGAGMVIMAKKKFESLPEAVRKVLDDNAGEALSRRYGATNDSEWDKGRAAVKAMPDQVVIAPTAAQHDAFRKKMAPVAEEFAKSTPGGEAVLAKFRELLAQVQKGG